ncbi:RibD family protein [Sphaerobacter thermophilus]|uniref:5-amino-6-(5-phosphoribosylamino)uracilreductase n=1 Tax=Sphaerobacter thermophilus (strain ATCC 49802 / DSM 20745 / KCCM 41009 / NCIMB 13125 / S 6022) TaxID=479434 RepID=D1CA66_SPHTD|nr:RibD family protein [Sphaerobacter thermophilus]ACZ40709.1 5-amino-6-(5-phosphoribosylamino)uracilreductase [Sphaerobacter thermophilus DSM 20745]
MEPPRLPALGDAATEDVLRELARPPEGAAPSDRPWATVAYAQTLDGRIATRSGDSRWVSCPDSLTFAHCLRAEHDAILVGIGTVLADDPRLTTRLVAGPSPMRVILDSRLRLPLDAAVLRDGAADQTLVVTTAQAPPERLDCIRDTGARVIVATGHPGGGVDLADAFHQLRELGIRTLLIEGGARTITAALRAGVVDRLAVCIAPKILGAGIEAVGDLGIDRLADALPLQRRRVLLAGDDLILIGDICPDSGEPPRR